MWVDESRYAKRRQGNDRIPTAYRGVWRSAIIRHGFLCWGKSQGTNSIFLRPLSQYATWSLGSVGVSSISDHDGRLNWMWTFWVVVEEDLCQVGVWSLDDFGHIFEWPAINQSALWSSGMIRASGNSHIKTMILCEVSGSIPDKALLSSFLTPAPRFTCFCFCLFLQVSLPSRDSAVCPGDLGGSRCSSRFHEPTQLDPTFHNLTSTIPRY